MKKTMLGFLGYSVAFLATWVLVGKAAMPLLFPAMYAHYGPQLSMVMAVGCVVGLISFLVASAVAYGITKEE